MLFCFQTLVIDSEQCRQYLERRGTGRPDPQPPGTSNKGFYYFFQISTTPVAFLVIVCF